MNTQKTETYLEQKRRHQNEVNSFNDIFWAFNDEQFNKGMEKLGLAVDDYKSIVSIGAGGFLLKSKREDFKAMFARQNEERKQLRKEEKLLIDGLVYELGNHEYCITHDPREAVESLGYAVETINQDTLKKAIKKYWELNQNN